MSMNLFVFPFRLWVLIILALLLGYYIYRTQRRGNWDWLSYSIVGFFGLILLFQGVAEYTWQKNEATYNKIASTIAGKDTRIHCQRFTETFFSVTANEGQVPFTAPGVPGQYAELTYKTCEGLASYLRSDKNAPSEDEIIAVHVLTHEAVHMSGDAGEGSTECKAMVLDAQTASALGATKTQADMLAADYQKQVYPRMPSNYRSPNCVPGVG